MTPHCVLNVKIVLIILHEGFLSHLVLKVIPFSLAHQTFLFVEIEKAWVPHADVPTSCGSRWLTGSIGLYRHYVLW